MLNGKRLTDAEIARFRTDGVVFPLRAMPAAEAGARLDELEAIEAARAGRLPPAFNAKPHLLLPSLWHLVQDLRVVDAVEDLLGPDLLCFGSSFISKAPGDGRHVSWHQDATHWGLASPEGVTAWIALSPSDSGSGCVQVIRGTHDRPRAHDHPEDHLNMLGRGERVAEPFDPARAVDVMLQPGEMSLHHPLVIHGSAPNGGGRRRTGFAIRYIAAHNRQAGGHRNSATLVRGRDGGHFDLEPPPEGPFHPAAMARHRGILRRGMAVIFDGAGRDG